MGEQGVWAKLPAGREQQALLPVTGSSSPQRRPARRQALHRQAPKDFASVKTAKVCHLCSCCAAACANGQLDKGAPHPRAAPCWRSPSCRCSST